MSSNTRRNLLRRARNLVVVNDGQYRWVGSRREVYAYLEAHGLERGYHRGYNTANSVTMDADQYQALCDSTTCCVDTSGSYGPAGEDPFKLIEAILGRGAVTLYIH